MGQKYRDHLRLRVAQEAAKLLHDGGFRDYQAAKRKAAIQLGAEDSRNLPSNQEVEAALMELQRIFHADTQADRLQLLRETAVEAMRFFSAFKPRLVGDVLNGTAGKHSVVELHLFADFPEQVVMFLMDQQIPYEEHQKRYRYGPERIEYYPVYRFLADEIAVELVVFPLEGMREAPASKVDGRPMKRADLDLVEDLLKVTV